MVQSAAIGPHTVLLASLDPVMAETIRSADRVAPTNTTVLITGETGTGKEVLARHIHARSPRHGRPFVAVNCGALPEHLIESELFGHERGAFSGATDRRIGHIQSAHRGTLVLDEISELPLSQQTRLLRVLQEREIQRIGSSQPEQVDVRVIATTNRSLPTMVEQGRFRRDLFFRLHVFPVYLPPLRARLADLPALVSTLLLQLSRRAVEVTPAAMTALAAQRYSGNIRELRNILERALVLAGDGPITPGHVAIPDWDDCVPAPRRRMPTDRLADREREAILQILVECDGNRTKASRRLGISVRTLRNRLRDYRFEGITVPKPGGRA